MPTSATAGDGNRPVPGDEQQARRRLAALLLVVAALVLLVYEPVFRQFGEAWSQYSEYNYAFLIPFISVFLIWRRWPQLRAQPLMPARTGAALLGAGLLMLIVGVVTSVHVAQGLSFIVVALGLVAFLWGWGATRVLLFPVAYLACGLGLFRGLASSVGFTMQGITAHYAHLLVNVMGVHATRDGLLLAVGHYQYLVAETCSGLSSLLSLLALGWLVAAEGSGSLVAKVLICLAIPPLVLVANITRVALVLVIAQDVSRAVAEGFVHSLFSVAIFLIALSLLLVIRKVLLWLDRSITLSRPRPS